MPGTRVLRGHEAANAVEKVEHVEAAHIATVVFQQTTSCSDSTMPSKAKRKDPPTDDPTTKKARGASGDDTTPPGSPVDAEGMLISAEAAIKIHRALHSGYSDPPPTASRGKTGVLLPRQPRWATDSDR